MYEYKVVLDRVIDGDTVDLFIELGFYTIANVRIRLLGVDAPEVRTKNEAEKELGLQAKHHVENWFVTQSANGRDVYIKTYKTEKYGRWLGILYYIMPGDPDVEMILNEELIDKGLAKVYDG
jgi:endonuclease YncB( thermonuclease family)